MTKKNTFRIAGRLIKGLKDLDKKLQEDRPFVTPFIASAMRKAGYPEDSFIVTKQLPIKNTKLM